MGRRSARGGDRLAGPPAAGARGGRARGGAAGEPQRHAAARPGRPADRRSRDHRRRRRGAARQLPRHAVPRGDAAQGLRAAARARGADAVQYARGATLAGSGRSSAQLREAVAAARRSDVVVAVVGLDPRLEGEEGDSALNPAGDRRDLGLPGSRSGSSRRWWRPASQSSAVTSGCDAPFDSTDSAGCFPPGAILPGVVYDVAPSHEFFDIFAVNFNGTSGNPSKAIGPDNHTDTLDIIFKKGGVSAAGVGPDASY